MPSCVLTDSQLVAAKELFDCYADTTVEGTTERALSVASLLQYIQDTGLKSLLEGEVRDIVAQMKQTDTVSQRNAEVFALQGPSTSSPNPVEAEGSVAVPFYLFVEIMLMGERELLSLCQRTTTMIESIESELLDVFTLVDKDGDGVISSGDLAAALERHFPKSSTETSKHIQAVLSELDINSDGRVDFEDFKRALKVS